MSERCPIRPEHVLCQSETPKPGDVQDDDLNPMVEGTEEKLEEEEQEEMKDVSSPPVPILPSREEVLKHRLTHRPFRSWCPHCIKGKSREDKHK